MKRIAFDQEWEFCEGTLHPMYLAFEQDAGKTVVDLPHDFSISKAPRRDCPEGEACGFLAGGLGTYMKHVEMPASIAEGRVLLELDGAYCNSEVTVNGHQVGIHPNGYMPYLFDLSPRLVPGDNRIAVFVNNMGRNTRWYAGTGIYRHAYLRVGERVHLRPDPAFLQTERVEDGCAFVLAEVFAENHTDRERKVHARIALYRDHGRGRRSETCEASGECVIFLPANGKGSGRARICVEHAAIWDIDDPQLYTAVIQLYEGERLIDEDSVLFGIRTISLDTKDGLRLNGRCVKLKGGCVHHDHGILGAASFYDAEYRRMKLHKENGFNAIRCAHNPMSRDMMEACDRLGLLVIAEAFDMWEMQKNANDYHLFFPDWWERDLERLIERDCNHPSIICWSIGNEIVERNGLSGGAQTCARLAEKVRSLDTTRFVTSGLPTPFNGLSDEDVRASIADMKKTGIVQNTVTSWWQEIFLDRTEAFCAPLDIVGYNYLEMRYERDLKELPGRIICGTESYNDQIADIWAIVERNPRLLGDFCWTSWDYLGEVWIGKCTYHEAEAAPQQELYPSRIADCACFDLLGNERPALAYHRIAWGSRETFIATFSPAYFGKQCTRSPWAWDGSENIWYYPGHEHERMPVDVYTAAAEAELLVNGVSCGRKRVGGQKRNIARFETEYVPGEVVAISYGAAGEEISRQRLTTPGKAEKIVLRADRAAMPADGQSLAFVEVLIADAAGALVPLTGMACTASLSGEGKLIAFGSADPVTEEVYTSGTFSSYRGRLLAVVRSGTAKGSATLTVSCEGLAAASIELILEKGK